LLGQFGTCVAAAGTERGAFALTRERKTHGFFDGK
jgi:hypothetical protein